MSQPTAPASGGTTPESSYDGIKPLNDARYSIGRLVSATTVEVFAMYTDIWRASTADTTVIRRTMDALPPAESPATRPLILHEGRVVAERSRRMALSNGPQRLLEPVGRSLASARDRGAALIEFAVVLPVLLSLVLGMIDFGLVLNDHQQLEEATRSGARRAIVGAAHTAICETEGLSFAVTSETTQLICSVKSSMPADVRVKIAFPDFVEGERLTLCTMAPTQSLTGVHNALSDGVATSRYNMRIENTDYAQLSVAQETALPEQDWSWCS